MTVLDQLKELDKQRDQLLNKAKTDALRKAEAAVSELNELGFNYSLVEENEVRQSTTTRGTRRTGIRQEVLDLIKKHPNGISRADILVQMDAKGDKSAEQSVSNALSALKKANTVTADNGQYKAGAGA